MILPKQMLRKAGIMEVHESQMQPAGVDITLKEVRGFSNAGKIDFDNSERKISDTSTIGYEKDEIHLSPGAYKVVFNEYVSIPGNAAGICLPRSSLLRCGASLECAVWDPGYEGRSEAMLVVRNEHGICLKRNAKIGQMVFIRLSEESESGYDGIYNGENKD
jgi:dUTP pyrophosphatase